MPADNLMNDIQMAIMWKCVYYAYAMSFGTCIHIWSFLPTTKLIFAFIHVAVENCFINAFPLNAVNKQPSNRCAESQSSIDTCPHANCICALTHTHTLALALSLTHRLAGPAKSFLLLLATNWRVFAYIYIYFTFIMLDGGAIVALWTL